MSTQSEQNQFEVYIYLTPATYEFLEIFVLYAKNSPKMFRFLKMAL